MDFKNGELRNEIYIKLENFHICRSKDFMTNLYSRTIFSIWISFHRFPRFTGEKGKEEGSSLFLFIASTRSQTGDTTYF